MGIPRTYMLVASCDCHGLANLINIDNSYSFEDYGWGIALLDILSQKRFANGMCFFYLVEVKICFL